MTIGNANEARQLANSSTHPKLQETLAAIEYWAGLGLYSMETDVPMPPTLINNLRSRGFSVYSDRKITW